MRALLLLALASPLSGQAFDVGPRFLRFGPAAEAESRARFGQNHGNALALGLRVESGWLRATVWHAETEAITDTARTDNPAPGARYDDVGLYGLTLGPGVRAGPLGIAFGVGAVAMTCSFHACGSSPMVDGLVSADADLCLGSVFRACLRAGAEWVTPREGRWTWLARDRAGEEPHGRSWVKWMHAGLTVGLAF